MPEFNFPYIVPIWLAYGSSCYFKGVHGDELAPFFRYSAPSFADLQRNVVATWRLTDRPPFIPRHIYSSELRTRYEIGDTFADSDGFYLPKEFRMATYRAGIADTDAPAFMLNGLLTNFTTMVPKTSFEPRLDGKTYTEDRRFATAERPIPQLLYLNTNEHWMGIHDAELLRIYRKQLAAMPPPPLSNYLSRRLISLLLLAVPTTILVIVIILRLKRSNFR